MCCSMTALKNGLSIRAGSNEMELGKYYYGTRNQNNIANTEYTTTTAIEADIDSGEYSSGNIMEMSAWYYENTDQLPLSRPSGIYPRPEAIVVPISEAGLTDKNAHIAGCLCVKLLL